ncbi:MAG: HAMP domain-containing protein [Nitrospira sp.]|nr:HAMP domain-containing protein [Nitrospira sp.]
MLKNLGKRITVVNIIAIIFVVMVGGVSILFTWKILNNGELIRQESTHFSAVNKINTDSYRIVHLIHRFIIEPAHKYAAEGKARILAIDEEIKQYKAIEQHMHAVEFATHHHELVLIESLENHINILKGILPLYELYERTGRVEKEKMLSYEKNAYAIENTMNSLSKIHLIRISEWEEESMAYMRIVFLLYIGFIGIGGLSVYVGHRLILKKVVIPIKKLAVATEEFANGKLDRRVSTDSQTEVGQLYDSFNEMAERIQKNDEFLRKFNEELEIKVRERTLELQGANEELRKTQDALIRTEKIAAVGQIAAGVTHEVKNPLNSLSINTQMLLKDLAKRFGTDSPEYESATLIRYEINRINNILEEFVKFAKFPEPKFFDNDMKQVIDEVTDLLVESAKDDNVELKLTIEETIPHFKFDARQIKEVLINLCQNAIKAIKNAGTVEVQASYSGGQVLIYVKDNGQGISEKNLEKIFSPFFSTKEGGMGLGLPIVQRIIESHGGKINCTSEVGKGTTFEILLPVNKA